MTAVRIDGLCVTLGRAEVVHGVGAAVEHGEWVALIGPNGAGKTTILRAIAGLVPFAGSVQLDGRAVDSSTRRQIARSVALVPQKPETPPALTVAEYILLGRTPHIAYLATEGRDDRRSSGSRSSRSSSAPSTRSAAASCSASSSPGRSHRRRRCSCSTSRRARSTSAGSSRCSSSWTSCGASTG